MADPHVANVSCSNCGEQLPLEIAYSHDKPPCGNCGSTASHVTVTIEDTIALHDSLEWEGNDSNLPSRKKQKKTRVEGKTGSEWSAHLQKMVHKERLIDRKSDRYQELVKDLETGEVIHEIDEPLSEHTGHGSAKRPQASC